MWWLSFADPDDDGRFLGVAIVRCNSDDIGDAVEEAWRLGCNPGGEVQGTELEEGRSIDPDYIGRLLNEQEAWKACGWLNGG